MFLAFVHDTLDPEWHRIDADVTPVQRSALCSYRAHVDSGDEAPWREVWKRLIAPPGAYCAKCENIAQRLTRDILDLPTSFDFDRDTSAVLKPVEALLGDDFKKLLDDL
jgi:hypothetical protein